MINKRDWYPSIRGFLLNSYYLERKELFDKIKSIKNDVSGKVLDLGCGNMPYKHLFSFDEYIGLELKDSECAIYADVLYDGKNLPFPDNYFDTVLSFQVFILCEDLNLLLSEINRVLKNKGCLIFSTPFIWFDSNDSIENRLSSFRTNYLLKKSSFLIKKSLLTCNNLSGIVLLLNEYITSEFLKNIYSRTLRIIFRLFFNIILNSIGLISLKLLPKSKSVYINRICIAEKFNIEMKDY